MLAVVWNSPWNPILWKAGQECRPWRGAGVASVGMGVNTADTLKARNHLKGARRALVRI